MIIFFLLIVVLLIGLTAAAVMGWVGGFMAEPTSSEAFPGLPVGLDDPTVSVSGDDIAQLRFSQALRGYRMDQVDDVIDALGARLRALEAEVASARADGLSHDASPEVRSDSQEQ